MVAPIERADLLKEIQRLAEKLGSPPTARDMNEQGEYSTKPYYREFESWNGALQEVDLKTNHNYNLTRDDLIEELTSLADDLGYTPVREDMNQFGRYSANPYYRIFDSWNEALRAAGFEIHHHRDATREELLEEIYRLSTRDKPPGRIQMSRDGKYSPQYYYTEFDSWTNAVREAGFEPRAFAPGNRREYDYGDGWDESKQESIRKRDDRECQHCGMDEQTHQERFEERLHVHHVVAAEFFDSGSFRNDPRNLVTLCRLHHRTWEAADDYCPLDKSLPKGSRPEEIDPYVR